MTKERKVEILYLKAKNEKYPMTMNEFEEMRKYGIDREFDINFATKKNLREYVTAVDNGCRLTFSDWCSANAKGDQRRKIGKADTMRENRRKADLLMFVFGTLTWGVSLMLLIPSIGFISFIIGAVVSFFISRTDNTYIKAGIITLPVLIVMIAKGAFK